MSRNAAMLAKNRATEAELEPGIWEPKDLKNHSFPWDSRESRPSIRLNGSEGHQPAGRVGLGQGASPISTCRAAAELLHDEDCRSVCVRVLPTYEGTFFLGKHGRGPNQGLGRRCAIVSVSNLPGCIFEQCSCAVSLALELELDHPMNFAGVDFKVAAAQGASCFASNGKARTRKKNLQVGLDVFFFVDILPTYEYAGFLFTSRQDATKRTVPVAVLLPSSLHGRTEPVRLFLRTLVAPTTSAFAVYPHF